MPKPSPKKPARVTPYMDNEYFMVSRYGPLKNEPKMEAALKDIRKAVKRALKGMAAERRKK